MLLFLFRAFGIICFLLLVPKGAVASGTGLREPAGPGYRARNTCPARCYTAGSDSSTWSSYYSLDQTKHCQQTVFYDFSFYDAVDDPNTSNRIFACASYGADWANLSPGKTGAVNNTSSQSLTGEYELGWWSDGVLAAADIRILARQVRSYFVNGHGDADGTSHLFARSGHGAIGIYVGSGLQNEATAEFALKSFEDSIATLNVYTSSIAMQLCSHGNDSTHTFGVMATSNGSFASVQEAIKAWSRGDCLTFNESTSVTGPAVLATLSTPSANATTSLGSNINATNDGSRNFDAIRRSKAWHQLRSTENEIRTFRNGDSTASAPQPNSDGSCATYTVKSSDNCNNIAFYNNIGVEQLLDFNDYTWGWSGCDNLWVGTIICLSNGIAPMPAPLPNAVCGPQVPGTTAPPLGTNISDLNLCPLNACCNTWGQCGVTASFCADTETGGCLSNCGANAVRRDSTPGDFRRIAFFDGDGLGRSCLRQDVQQISTSEYTHIHFTSGVLTDDYKVSFGASARQQFASFKKIKGAVKILSLGGWEFSTSPKTYSIFRLGVTATNRKKMVASIADYVTEHMLDGVEIDWQYPGARGILGVPTGSEEDGTNYLAFLVALKERLPDKSVSITAPASYWYLREFPISEISATVDYIVFMTFDFHGQWDAGNPYAQNGCPSGTCLRSSVNSTETQTALTMLEKAGVPPNKIVASVTSFGRSFAMADDKCHTEQCKFTGMAAQSNAKKGHCTNLAGILSNAEIKEIMRNASRVNHVYVDENSDTDILVYDDNQWVGWLSSETKTQRKNHYQLLGLGGVADWTVDLDDNIAPGVSIRSIEAGRSQGLTIRDDPVDWKAIKCTDNVARNTTLTPEQRWNGMGCPEAWQDLTDEWVKNGRRGNFSNYVVRKMGSVTPSAQCDSLGESNGCEAARGCLDFEQYSVAYYAIWESFVAVHGMFDTLKNALVGAAALGIVPKLKDFENKFAPIPPKDDDIWMDILLDLIGIGVPYVTGGLFKKILGSMPFFKGKGTQLGNAAEGTNVASEIILGVVGKVKSSDSWTTEKQDAFSTTMSNVLTAWGDATSYGLSDIFSGSSETLPALTDMIKDGQLIGGDEPGNISQRSLSPRIPVPANIDVVMEAMISKVFFAFSTPVLWQASGVYPVVLDSGFECGVTDPLGQYLDTKTMHATAGCHDGRLYYLVHPEGSSQSCSISACGQGCLSSCKDSEFSALPGLEFLDGSAFGGVTVSDLISGAVRTYKQNGEVNGGEATDPTNAASFAELYKEDVTTPGFVRIPVCSPDIAYRAWSHNGGPQTSAPNYPCSVDVINKCGDSSFVDQTSDASGTVDDCLHIVKNIEGTDGEWHVDMTLKKQHQLVQFGSCAFGVQAKKKGPSPHVEFNVGAQDIVDLIRESATRFGGSGKVGAKGNFACEYSPDVEWGLYHD